MTKKKGQATAKELTSVIIEGIQDKKGVNITCMDLKELDGAVTDYFIICEGNSSTQIDAIKDSIEKLVREKLGEKPWHVEGTANLEWVLMDYVNVVVHIFNREKREFYNLEGLWADAEVTEIDASN